MMAFGGDVGILGDLDILSLYYNYIIRDHTTRFISNSFLCKGPNKETK